MIIPKDEVIRVAIVEDEPLMRKGLSLLIDGTAGYRSAGVFGSVEEALRGLSREAPDMLSPAKKNHIFMRFHSAGVCRRIGRVRLGEGAP